MCNKIPFFARIFLKIIITPIYWILLPFVTFFREFWATFRFETASGSEKSKLYRDLKTEASKTSTRVKIIEICTESSFQPLFQLYIVYFSLVRWAIGTGMVTRNQEDDQHFHLIVNRHWREMLSIGVSILSLSWGYTSHYRRSKNGALGILPTLIYFMSTLLFVFTRILCFLILINYISFTIYSQLILNFNMRNSRLLFIGFIIAIILCTHRGE